MSHHSLRFDCEGLSVVIAGDAVATRDFWRERRGYYNCVDFELAAKSMDQIAGLADIVVPGHDNFFLNPPALPILRSAPGGGECPCWDRAAWSGHSANG